MNKTEKNSQEGLQPNKHCWNCNNELDNEKWCNNCRVPISEHIKQEILNRDDTSESQKCWRCDGTTEGDICSICGSPLSKKGIQILSDAINKKPASLQEESEENYLVVFSPKDNHLVLVDIPIITVLNLVAKHFQVYNATVTKIGPEIIVYRPNSKSVYDDFETEEMFISREIRILFSKTKATSVDETMTKIQFFYWKAETKSKVFNFANNRWKYLLIVLSLTTVFLSSWFYYQKVFTYFAISKSLFVDALIFTAALTAILAIHEGGHLLLQRLKGVNLSQPYFLPLPPIPGFLSFFMLGTAGGFIRVLNPIRKRETLFDIYFYGPLFGFVISICFYLIGLAFPYIEDMTNLSPEIVTEIATLTQYDPNLLITRFLNWFGVITRISPSFNPETQLFFLHPLAYAGLCGIIINGLNFLPGALLDGGFLLRSMAGKKMLTVFSICSALLIMLNYNTWALGILVLYIPISKYQTPVTNEASSIHWSRYLLFTVGIFVAIISYPIPLYFFV